MPVIVFLEKNFFKGVVSFLLSAVFGRCNRTGWVVGY